MICPVLRRVFVGAVFMTGLCALAQARVDTPKPIAGKPPLQRYETDYYIIFTDQDANMVREASARMKVMAEEYYRRTKAFGGVINKKFPFYLYSDPNDYYAAEGPKGSAGVYIHAGSNGRLMAMAPSTGGYVWHVVQHEAFHQFVHMIMGGKLPIWQNEGLAEYFAEASWTGDGLVTGVIPWNPKHGSHRMADVKESIKDNKFMPFKKFFDVTPREWNSKVEDANSSSHAYYDQAWSMVQFFVHADEGKYRNAYGEFIADLARGTSPHMAYANRFGRDGEAIEKRYRQWWLEMKDDAPLETFAQATVATLTSFMARAYGAKIKFESADDFFKAGEEGKLYVDPRTRPKLWLPPSLLNRALAGASWLKEWSIQTSPKGVPKLVLKLSDGKTFTGSFNAEKLFTDRPPEVTVKIESPNQPAKTDAKTQK